MKYSAFKTSIVVSLGVASAVFIWADLSRAAVSPKMTFRFDRNAKTAVPGTHAERFAESRFQHWRDHFPTLENPNFVSSGDVDFLKDTDLVIGVEVNGEARAYPVLVATYHHVINDELGGQPLTISTCGVCSSAAGFDPRLDGQTLRFRFEGIWQGTMVMYDIESESVWLHLTGECVKGPKTGQKLRMIPTRYVQWSEWKCDYPQTTVVQPEDDVRYFPEDELIRGNGGYPRGFGQTIQDRSNFFRRFELMYGLKVDDDVRAFPIRELRRLKSFVTNQVIGERQVVIGVNPATGSAFGFDATVNSTSLRFHGYREGKLFATDGSVFSLSGICVAGPLKGHRLSALTGIQAEWYGWYAAHPDTDVWDHSQHEQVSPTTETRHPHARAVTTTGTTSLGCTPVVETDFVFVT